MEETGSIYGTVFTAVFTSGLYTVKIMCNVVFGNYKADKQPDELRPRQNLTFILLFCFLFVLLLSYDFSDNHW